jgi:hypothetical protein
MDAHAGQEPLSVLLGPATLDDIAAYYRDVSGWELEPGWEAETTDAIDGRPAHTFTLRRRSDGRQVPVTYMRADDGKLRLVHTLTSFRMRDDSADGNILSGR